MTSEVSDADMFFTKTTKEVWDTYKANYSKVDDAVQIYEIKMKVFETKQGIYSVCDYARTLQNLWQKLDHYEQFEAKGNEYKEKDKIYKFLIGLNMSLTLLEFKC